MALPSPIPDNPRKWDEWRAYSSENPYERLCLSFESNPSDWQIEDNCRQLLVWWQKKLPLKNQPSNPLAQLLRAGLDEAPRYLAEARMQLLNPEMRGRVDERLRGLSSERAHAEFEKFLSFTLSSGVLSPESEESLYHHGAELGLNSKEMKELVDAELARRGAVRHVPRETASPVPSGTVPPRIAPGSASTDPAGEFARLLKLTGLGEDEMTDDQRDALCNMGENLGLSGGEAEDLIDAYLEEGAGAPLASPKPSPVPSKSRNPVPPRQAPKPGSRPGAAASMPKFLPLTRSEEISKHPPFTGEIGQGMLLVPSGVFVMGNNAPEAPPNEKPVSKTMVSCYYISRFPVTNQQYERFDPSHRLKRPPWADETHPVVYVSSVEAIKFCAWLSSRERRKYRLPTEAEWEYAARGTDGRSYPWGEILNRGDLANFADANTTFPWRVAEIDDGYAQSSPVGAYPKGVSPFGIEDLSGNVWEWCLDFFEPYKSHERVNPRGALSGSRRVYRGGSWKSRASSLRATTRNFNTPDYSSNDVGFRIVCECE